MDPYIIAYTHGDIRVEAEGPLLIEHVEIGVQKANARCNTLDASIDIYYLKNIKVYDIQDNILNEAHENYKIYELNSSGPMLSFQQETLHGKFPLLSNNVYYISLFEKYNENLSHWVPKNLLNWDNEQRILTINVS